MAVAVWCREAGVEFGVRKGEMSIMGREGRVGVVEDGFGVELEAWVDGAMAICRVVCVDLGGCVIAGSDERSRCCWCRRG